VDSWLPQSWEVHAMTTLDVIIEAETIARTRLEDEEVLMNRNSGDPTCRVVIHLPASDPAPRE
jgi:hypothetical protein